MGPFVPFKDFKGNINEAMNKLITELRKFGYSQGKAILPDQVKSGYGD